MPPATNPTWAHAWGSAIGAQIPGTGILRVAQRIQLHSPAIYTTCARLHARLPTCPIPPACLPEPACRAQIEADFKGLLSDKEAESARLRAEISRLRAALTHAQSLHASQGAEVQALSQQAQQAAATSK